jgi:flagellar basal body-associated protein FliL
MSEEKKPSEKSNKNLIIPLVIFIGVSIAAYLITTLVINMLN